VGAVVTGRKGAKLAKMAAATALNAASYYSARGTAERNGQSTFSYDVYGVRAASASMALRPDGRVAYVFNSLTNDVTIVDTLAAKAEEKVPVPGGQLVPLPSGRFVAVASPAQLSLLDTTTNALAGRWELPGLLPLSLTPDRTGILAVAEKSVVVVDLGTGQVTGRSDTFLGNSDSRLVERHLPPPPKVEPPAKKAEPAKTPKAKARPKAKPAAKPKPGQD
jgi:DNA-binding beta-propeller fold protein YncE